MKMKSNKKQQQHQLLWSCFACEWFLICASAAVCSFLASLQLIQELYSNNNNENIMTIFFNLKHYQRAEREKERWTGKTRHPHFMRQVIVIDISCCCCLLLYLLLLLLFLCKKHVCVYSFIGCASANVKKKQAAMVQHNILILNTKRKNNFFFFNFFACLLPAFE